MQVRIGSELDERVRERAASAGMTVDAYVEELVLEDLEDSADGLKEAVAEGLAEAERGEGRPAAEVFADFRRRHGISR